MRHVVGRCHCSRISFDVYLPTSGGQIPVRACGCSFCRKHGGAWTSHPEGRLVVHLSEPEEVGRYRFGHRSADFYICKQCGLAPFVVSTEHPELRAVVNVNLFENVQAHELVRSASDFDAESVGERLTRRERNWIADVSFE